MRFARPTLIAPTLIAASLAMACPAMAAQEAIAPPSAPSPDSQEPDDRRPTDTAETADSDDAEKAQPETAIVVTARRLDDARTRIDAGLGATVYSLSNDTIENRPGGETGSIASILTQAPGVTLAGSGLTIRGSHSVQVRINDIILPEAISDPADQLSSRLAATTRLVTGTLPAQFGFAPGGVISVTTKNGLYQAGGQAELFIGSGGMIEPAIEWSDSFDNSSLYVTASAERTRARVADTSGNIAKDRRREEEGLLFADHVLGPNDRISLILGGANERHRIAATSLPPGLTRSWNGYAVGVVQHHAGPFSLQGAMSIAGAASRADFGRLDRERRTSRGLQLDGNYQAGTHRVGAGLLLTRETARQGRAATSARTSLGVYVQDQWTLTPAVTLDLGLRANRFGGRQPAIRLEPRAALVGQLRPGLTAHLGYARYSAAAPVGETGSGLPVERDDYFGAGVQQKLGPVTLGIDAYARSARNLIAEKRILGEASTRAFSFARGRMVGVEFSATYARGPMTGWASLALSRSRAKSIVGGRDLFTQAALDGAQGWVALATDRPVSGSGGLTWRRGRLSLSGDVTASSGAVRTSNAFDPNGARAPAFATFGLAAVYHARIAGRPADVRLDLTNLTGVRYLTNDSRNLEGDWTRFGPGRAIVIGLEQGF